MVVRPLKEEPFPPGFKSGHKSNRICNNEGALVFDYSLEDTDTTAGGADIFNGQQSVLWINLRQAFFNDIKTMYQTLRSQGKLSYSLIENAFETHQAKWPEAIFNEDAWFKYIDPFVNDGTDYLNMAQGSKAEQRKWWLYNRFRYIDSKYNAGDALTDVITLRGYAKANITVTPYATIYPAIKYGSYLVTERGQRDVSTTLVCPLDSVNDTEIYIYSASQLSSIGDLSGLQVGLADLSNGTKLQSIKLGDASANYSNANMYALTLGNNTLLKTIDVRNCVGLGDTSLEGHTQTSVSIRNCANIEYAYFGGTKIKALELPDGGILKTLQLPSTITSLVVRNHPSLTTFSIDDDDYSNITALWVENSGVYIPYRDILEAMPAGSNVRLIGAIIESESASDAEGFIDILDSMLGLDENGNPISTAVISGTMTVDDSVMQTWIDDINAKYPNLLVIPTSVTSDVIAYLGNTLTKWEDNSVTSIRNYAFAKSTALTTVKTSAATINPYAFYNCTGLNTVDLTSEDPITISANAFNTSRAYHTFIRSNTVSTLSATSAFESTRIIGGTGAIYVPDNLVDSYKAATNWSSFKNQIYPIGDYPVTDFSTIEDDWGTILTNPNYATDYKIGDRKSFVYNGTSTYYLEIIAFDTDILSSDHQSKAGITWRVNVAFGPRRMNSTNTNGISATDADQYNTGLSGWPSTELRYYLRETLFYNFPEVIRNAIKPVDKTYYDNTSNSTKTISDTLWIPSTRDLNYSGTYLKETSGVTYSVRFPNNASKIMRFTTGSAYTYWTRSASSSVATSFFGVDTNGNDSITRNASVGNQEYYVVFFCT